MAGTGTEGAMQLAAWSACARNRSRKLACRDGFLRKPDMALRAMLPSVPVPATPASSNLMPYQIILIIDKIILFDAVAFQYDMIVYT